MKTNLRLSRALTAAVILAIGAGTAAAYANNSPSKADAKITMEQAKAQALQLQPGSIKDAELEHEQGGSGLRYSFDIQTQQGEHEVGIDAMNDKVLENGMDHGDANGIADDHKDGETQDD
ncbi:PepSY domain-containing protein [Halothiobacillus sp.]|uniref:PepSY domain-containing protein n=1 Tax=Halothiobacillus sp. TaxID=1891311 RepID=UPI00261D5625|nr:PepSY domain-containing protein [Halothiobacillus sp.]